MVILNTGEIAQFIQRHPLARKPFAAWLAAVEAEEFADTSDFRERWPTATFLGNDRIIFRLHGNYYLLLVVVDYHRQQVRVPRVGTQGEYSRWKL